MAKTITITIMFAIAAMLLMADSDSITALLLTKAAGLALGYAAVRLCDSWQSALSNFINADENE